LTIFPLPIRGYCDSCGAEGPYRYEIPEGGVAVHDCDTDQWSIYVLNVAKIMGGGE
jgi:hypothetical protein